MLLSSPVGLESVRPFAETTANLRRGKIANGHQNGYQTSKEELSRVMLNMLDSPTKSVRIVLQTRGKMADSDLRLHPFSLGKAANGGLSDGALPAKVQATKLVPSTHRLNPGLTIWRHRNTFGLFWP